MDKFIFQRASLVQNILCCEVKFHHKEQSYLFFYKLWVQINTYTANYKNYEQNETQGKAMLSVRTCQQEISVICITAQKLDRS